MIATITTQIRNLPLEVFTEKAIEIIEESFCMKLTSQEKYYLGQNIMKMSGMEWEEKKSKIR